MNIQLRQSPNGSIYARATVGLGDKIHAARKSTSPGLLFKTYCGRRGSTHNPVLPAQDEMLSCQACIAAVTK